MVDNTGELNQLNPLEYQKQAVKLQQERITQQGLEERVKQVTPAQIPTPVEEPPPRLNTQTGKEKPRVFMEARDFVAHGAGGVIHEPTPQQKQDALHIFQTRMRLSEEYATLRRQDSLGSFASSIKENAVPIGLSIVGTAFNILKTAVRASMEMARTEQKPAVIVGVLKPPEVKTAIGKPVQPVKAA